MKQFLIVIFCALSLQVNAQSFESLKRSKGKTELYSAVQMTLSGEMSVDECKQAFQKGSLTDPYNGKTPIYLVLDYLATHKEGDCQVAEQVLDIFLSRKDFDVNMRYSTLMPPLAYLIRSNYDYLGGKFSADYISDNVLKKLISAGAEVDTYNSDGSTLMSFALDTDNKYLQTYFLNNGIDLRHGDQEGKDDVYKIIAEGNLPLLKDALQKRLVSLTFHQLKNDPKDFAHHKDMYNFLAQRFADEVSSYDEIVSFRKKFNPKKGLVEQKYQKLAQNEIDAIKTFDDIISVEKRYPDLEVILKAKRAFYQKDCQKLEGYYNAAVQSARANQINLSSKSAAETITRLYTGYNYDPDNKMRLGRELSTYHAVCEGLDLSFASSYWGYGRPPYYNDHGHGTIIERSLQASNEKGTVFEGFFNHVRQKIISKKELLNTRLSESYNKYREAYKRYKEEREIMISNAENLSDAEILRKNKTIPEKWSEGRFFDSDDDFTDHKYISFADGVSFTISWRYKNKDGEYISYYFGGASGKYHSINKLICDMYRENKVRKIKEEYPL